MCKLYFYYGTMGSCKSMLLMTTAFNMDQRNIKTLTMKPSIDTRDGEGVIHSRVGISRKCLTFDQNEDLYSLVIQIIAGFQYKDVKWIFVDECQFLTEEQVDQLSDIVKEMNDMEESEEKKNIIESIESLYNDIDQNISDLIKGRKHKIAALEGKAMYNLEKLAVDTQHELTVILNYIREH